ncbi:MAG: HEPN domain-containing protein [Candidatus Pacearchaeota archaeon]|nr:HEPN domain-containing protein [Candidatus Pacearchaeota archaeon]
MNLELINYRRKRAKDTLEDAKIMFNKVSLFTTVNRIYYAIFYEVLALLLTKDLSSSKHSGVRALFNREFVKSKIVKEEYADFYNRMFDFRQKGDYGDFVEFEREKVKEWLSKAERFINEVDEIIAGFIEGQK